MDVFTSLNHEADYSSAKLQVILGAWVLASPFDKAPKISTTNGDVAEDDYTKQSVYSLLYSLYRSMGQVDSDDGQRYELTFNTWGYAWPESWGPNPSKIARDPQRFGQNAYAGLFEFPEVKAYVAARGGKVHVIEMGCGTGAGAHHVASRVLPDCTYEAFDMQQAAINTCRRKFVPELGGRLRATRADCTALPAADASADLVAVCETHVAEMPGTATEEDRKFFNTVRRVLKPGGYFVWGNAIPDATWAPCFAYLESIGMKQITCHDVTREAIAARDQDERRVDLYVRQCLERFGAFRIPMLGTRRRHEAELAMKNFYRNPGTNLYDTMINGTDTYKVTLFQKTA